MKKLFALLLAVIMVVSMAACAPAEPAGTTAGKADTTTAPAATTTVAATTTEPKLDLSALPFVEPGSEKITIGIQTNATVLDYNDNYYTKYIEENTGIDIEFVHFSSDKAEAQTQLNLMMANKEKLPDIIVGNVIGESASRVAELAKEGFLVDLTEYFEEYGYWFKQWESSMTDNERENMWARVADPSDGGYYYFPAAAVNDGIDSNGWQGGINKVFAKNLGLNADDIDTVAEVYEFLTKAVNNDGNGNGVKDELGMVYYDKGYAYLEEWIINAYIPITDAYVFNVNDGKLWVPYDTDEYRQAVIELTKWYQEGLIYPGSFSGMGHPEVKALVDTPDNYKVAIYGGHATLMTNADSNIGLQYQYLNVLEDETGKGGYGFLRERNTTKVAAVLSADCENPVLAFRLMDWLTNPTAQKIARYGEEGVHWEWIDGEAEGLKDRRQHWASFRVISDEWSKETKATWHYNPFNFSTTNQYTEGPAAGIGLQPFSIVEGSRNEITYNGLYEMEGSKLPEESVYSLVYNAEENEVISEYKSAYKSFVKEARRKFMTGVMDPTNDADWEQYLKELEQNGQTELLEVSQAAYDRMHG